MKSDSEEGLFRAKTLLGLQFLSDFGDQITATLLALYLLEITQSTSQVGMVYFFSTFGFLVFTLAGGFLGTRSADEIFWFFPISAGGSSY